MAIHEGEIYRCPEERCGCEYLVTRGPVTPAGGGDEPPRCGCGQEMRLDRSLQTTRA